MSLQLPPLSLKLCTYKEKKKENLNNFILRNVRFKLIYILGEMWMNWTGTVIHLSH